jgi:hypothetical protein
MLRNIEPHNLSATVNLDDHDVEQSKRGGHGDERIDGGDAIASLRRKLRHVGEGVPTRRTMYFATVARLTSMPSFKSLPWIRGAPQSGLALFICRIRSRTSRSTDGRPDLERQRQ